MNCNVNFVCHEIRPKTLYINFHQHNCYEIVYYLRGSGTTKINNKTFNFFASSVSIIAPNTAHDESYYENTEVIFIGFTYNDKDFNLCEGVYTLEYSKIIAGIMKSIVSEAEDQPKHYNMMISHKTSELLIEISRIRGATEQKCKDFYYIINYIQENHSQKINLRNLAQLCGYSYDYFRHMFKAKTGFAPQLYLINCRLKASKKLLIGTNIKIIDISLKCGFSNSAQFSTMFKKYYHMTPKEFRNFNNKKENEFHEKNMCSRQY